MDKKKNKIAVVLGSNSFSAGSMISKLLKNNYTVIGVSRSKFNEPKFQRFNYLKKNFKFFKLDINKDIKKIINLIKFNKPKFILNYAAQSMVGQSWENPSDWFLTNSFSTIKFYNHLSKLDFKFRLIHISTPEVYGNTTKKITENNYYNPTTPYAVSRVTADQYLKILHENKNLNYCSIRASNVYGEFQRVYRIIPKTILFILKKKKLKLDGGGVSERNFIHIDDVSSATLKVMIRGKSGEIYHVSSNKLISIRDLVKLVCKKMNYDFDKLVSPGPERIGKDKSYILSNSKIVKLGWKTKINLQDGINKCIKNIRKYLREYNFKDENYIHKK